MEFGRSDLVERERVEIYLFNVEFAEQKFQKRLAFSLGETAILPSESNRGGKEY